MTNYNQCNPCNPCKPCCCNNTGMNQGGNNRGYGGFYAFILVIFILLVICGAGFWA